MRVAVRHAAAGLGEDPATARARYVERERALLGYYAGEFGGGPEDLELERFAADLAAAPARAAALDIERGAGGVARVLDVGDGEPLRVTTLIGWHRATAWFDAEAPGGPQAFFCLEQLSDDPVFCAQVGAHETAHLAHHLLRAGAWRNWGVLEGLVMEALALATAREVVPEATDRDLFVLTHPEETLARWEREEATIRRAVLALLDADHEDAFRRVLFPDWGREVDPELPEQVGYPVALALADRWLAEGETLASVARWDVATARERTVAALTG